MRKHSSLSNLIMISAFVVACGSALPAFAESAGQYIDDATVTTKVKAALMSDSQLKATKVSVETDNGIVKLTGDVDNKNEESQAVNDASKVDGVKSVKDELRIGGSSTSSPSSSY